MPRPVAAGFAELVGRLAEAMGQRFDAVKTGPEGILMRTSDGFLFAFLEDPSMVSLRQVQRLLEEVGRCRPTSWCSRRGACRLPSAQSSSSTARPSWSPAGSRSWSESSGWGSILGDEPRPAAAPGAGRLLPSAHLLDAVMQRGRTWLEWGVPALALRFYRQASTLKPEFAPARTGIGQALLALGLSADARRAFEEALQTQPRNLDGRLGLAAVLGAEGHVEKEIDAYRALIVEDPGQVAVRAHLIAALISQGHWAAARDEIAQMLRDQPEDPQMRFLHSVALEKTGAAKEAGLERDRARRLGLDPTRERALCAHLGLPIPDVPIEAPSGPGVPPPPRSTSEIPRPPPRSRASSQPTAKPRARKAMPSKKPPRKGRPAGRKPK